MTRSIALGDTGQGRSASVREVPDISPAETVRIGVLGALQVRDPDGRPVKVGGRRLRALVILLALDAGRMVPAHSLIGRLWPDERPADAANALQSLVSRLRATLR